MDTISQMWRSVEVSQLMALSCQAVSLVASIGFYHFLHIKTTSVNMRHAVSAMIGVGIAVLCYGSEALHLFGYCTATYLFMTFLPAPYRGWTVFASAVIYVLGIHLYQYITHYMEFPIEVSNSLMIMAMKVSFTGFSLDDGRKPDDKLTKNQLKYKLTERMSFFEYFCFCFCFLGFMFGPAYHFRDYMTFINGDQYRTQWQWRRGARYIGMSLIALFLHIMLVMSYGARYNLAPEVMNSGFLLRHFVLWMTMFVARQKYYFGWLSSEGICYLGGLGYDPSETGEKEWGESIPTVRVSGIELSTSLKMFADCWNIFTAKWLHFCVYERVPFQKVLCVFLLSATWHGFYPGYYMMFFPLAFAIILGRKLRRTVRPVFQGSTTTRAVYDIITWAATTLLIAFNSCAFELKAWEPIYKLQRSLYFWPHVIVLAGVIIWPAGKASHKQELVSNGKAVGNDNHSEPNAIVDKKNQEDLRVKG